MRIKFNMKYFLLSLVLLVTLAACQHAETSSNSKESKKRGVLSEYVNSPLESAKSADQVGTLRNKTQQEALDQIDEE